MAEIFLARSRGMANFGRYVVLKRILPERGTDERWIEMFLDEARLAAQLQHPNIAHVFDLGRLGEGYFFTMEYVHGANMREVLVRCSQRGHRLPLSTAVAVGVGAAAGLEHAHSRKDANGRPLGIVHRDVSPSNLMLSFEGAVKLVDFGVAKALSRSSVTQSGTVKGKVSYLSPEQCRGKPVDHRSDLFALGIVLYEMVTTKRLYRRATDFETMTAIVTEQPEPPSRYNPEVSARLDAVILRALAKDPARRQQSAGELQEELEDIAHAEGLPTSNTHLRRQMRELFGDQPEPWHALEAGGTLPKREVEVTYTADGLLEEDLESVEVPVPAELDYGVSGPVAMSSTAPMRRTAALAAMVAAPARVTQAFPIEVDAAQVPLLDSLRAAIAATDELDAERSASKANLANTTGAASEHTAAHADTVPSAAKGITLTDPSGPPDAVFASAPGGAHAAPQASASPDSGLAEPRARRGTAQPVPGATPAPSDSGAMPAAPRLSEAITIPAVGGEPPPARPATALPSSLAAGLVTMSPAGAPSGPTIWDRPMPSPPAPEPGPRSASTTPGYQPKMTLLGSAPPPNAGRGGQAAPGVSVDARPATSPAQASTLRLPGLSGPSQPATSAPPGPSAPSSSTGFAALTAPGQPVYPRAPVELSSSSMSRQILPPARSRRGLWIGVALSLLVGVGIALGAILAGTSDEQQPAPAAQVDASLGASSSPDAAAPALARAPDAAIPDAAAPDAPPDAAPPDAATPDAATPDAAPRSAPVPTTARAPGATTGSADDCKDLSSRSPQELRIKCVVEACERKQVEAARRMARPLPAAVIRDLLPKCPGFVRQTSRPADPPTTPTTPPCTGPLCRR